MLPIYVSENLVCAVFAMLFSHIVHDLGDQMVFEGAFYYLVQKIGRQQFVDVSPWKMVCERLVVYVKRR